MRESYQRALRVLPLALLVGRAAYQEIERYTNYSPVKGDVISPE